MGKYFEAKYWLARRHIEATREAASRYSYHTDSPFLPNDATRAGPFSRRCRHQLRSSGATNTLRLPDVFCAAEPAIQLSHQSVCPLQSTLTPPSSPNQTPSSSQVRLRQSRQRTRPPLAASTYYRRNIARTLPVGGSISISVFLIAAIVTLLNSVDRSITVNYGFTRHFSVLTTQLIQDVPKRVSDKIRRAPGVESVIIAIPYVRAVRTVFGQMPVPVYGLDRPDMHRLVKLSGNTLEGNWPTPGQPEIVLSRAWALNYGKKIGQYIESTDENLPTIQAKQKIVGLLDGGDHLAVADKDYLLLELPEPVIRPTQLIVPKPGQMVLMNESIRHIVDHPKLHGLGKGEVQYVKYYTFDGLVRQLRKTLGFLYKFLTIADALVIGAVALLSGFLANIYFEQRLGEFGLLSAFGFRRERLARRVVVETGLLVVAGWTLGLGLTCVGFFLLDALYMKPNGLVLASPDITSVLYTAPIPILVGIASLATVLLRLYRMDPIEIMERR